MKHIGCIGDECPHCAKFAAEPERYANVIAYLTGSPSPPSKSPCDHLGPITAELVECKTCAGKVSLRLFECEVYGRCTIGRKVDELACCVGCPSYKSQSLITSIV